MADLSGYTILVVDDETDTRLFIAAILSDSGADILEAGNGDEALVVARRDKPDLITLDIQMPGKDGEQVFSELRQDPELNEIPVCIISGRPELRKLIYQRVVPPPDGFMDKPIDERNLLLNIRKILKPPRQS